MIRMAWRSVVRGMAGIAVLAGGAAFAADDAKVSRGAEIARSACAECHAIGPTGRSSKADAPPFRELGRKYPVEHLEEALAEGVMVGHSAMPRIEMNEADIGAFIAYLKTVQTP